MQPSEPSRREGLEPPPHSPPAGVEQLDNTGQPKQKENIVVPLAVSGSDGGGGPADGAGEAAVLNGWRCLKSDFSFFNQQFVAKLMRCLVHSAECSQCFFLVVALLLLMPLWSVLYLRAENTHRHRKNIQTPYRKARLEPTTFFL